MQALKKLRAWAYGWWQKPKAKDTVDISARLPDEVKHELAHLARFLKGEHVSVRELHSGEIASDIPEIGEQPLVNEGRDG